MPTDMAVFRSRTCRRRRRSSAFAAAAQRERGESAISLWGCSVRSSSASPGAGNGDAGTRSSEVVPTKASCSDPWDPRCLDPSIPVSHEQVAANVALRDYPETVRQILIVDLDVHQGNGNAVLFAEQPSVFTFSMHCKTNYFSKVQVRGRGLGTGGATP